MNWKKLTYFPLAALLLGRPLHPPLLNEKLPEHIFEACKNTQSIEFYLRAYAYSTESTIVSVKLLNAADDERLKCNGDTESLKKRIEELRKKIYLGQDSS